MHLAHFVHRYPPALGGCEAYVERLSRHLVQQGDTVRVWTSNAVELTEMWQPPCDGSATGRRPLRIEHAPDREEIRRYPPLTFPLRRYILKAISLVPIPPLQALTMPCNPICPAMWHDAKRDRAPLDAVHAFAFPYSFPAFCGLRLARRRRVPFVLTPFLHLGDATDPRDRTRRQYTSRPLRWLLHQADRVFVQTTPEYRAVVELGVPESRVVLQGLGVEAAECTGGDRKTARIEWGIADEGEVVVGHLANQSIEKGTVDLLHTAACLWDRGVPFRVVLAGPQMPNFLEMWNRFPWKNRVVQLGVLTEPQKRDFFAGIDLFALPSRCDSFGLVLLEAWANGKPNVCYRAGGPGDLIRDGDDGRLARCDDRQELATCLESLILDHSQRVRMGERGRERLNEFRWNDKLARVRNTLREICCA